MTMSNFYHGARGRRKGAAAIFGLVMLVVLIGFASLTVDVGAMYNTRADLQNAADSAALAGASAYVLPLMTQIRMGKASVDRFGEVSATGLSMAQQTGLKNWSFGAQGTAIPDSDIRFGYIDTASSTSGLESGGSASKFNAVEVVTQRSASVNGVLQFFFSPVFGKKSTTVSASAVAALDDHFSAYDIAVSNAAPLWPFTIHEDDYAAWLATGTDKYAYDPDTDKVSASTDEEVEIKLYPDKMAPGNYGLLNVGGSGSATSYLQGQITNGISTQDMVNQIGSEDIAFYNDSGDPISYSMPGSPGLKSSLEASIKGRIGDVVGFFVHDDVNKTGSNTSYNITGIRYARVMHVQLQGSSKTRGLHMQPVMYNGPGVITTPGAPSSDNAGRLVLVR